MAQKSEHWVIRPPKRTGMGQSSWFLRFYLFFIWFLSLRMSWWLDSAIFVAGPREAASLMSAARHVLACFRRTSWVYRLQVKPFPRLYNYSHLKVEKQAFSLTVVPFLACKVQFNVMLLPIILNWKMPLHPRWRYWQLNSSHNCCPSRSVMVISFVGLQTYIYDVPNFLF